MLISNNFNRKGNLSGMVLLCTLRIDPLQFFRQNLWISFAAILILLVIVIFQFTILRRIKIRQNLISRLSDNQGPLSPRNLLSTLMNNLPDFIYVKDNEGKYIVASKKLANWLGKDSANDIIGKTDFNISSKELADKNRVKENKIMETGVSQLTIEESKDKNENRIWLKTTLLPIKDKNGESAGVIGISRDITELKIKEAALNKNSNHLKELNTRLEERQEEVQQQSEELKSQSEYLLDINEKLEKLSLVASKTDNVIIIMDKEGNFEWVNAGFIKRYKMDLEEFSRKKGRNLLQNSSYPDIKEIFNESFRTRKALLYTARTQLSEKEHIWSQTTISPVLDDKGDVVRFIAIDSDITRLKEAELKIENQRDELTKLNATKDKFFSIIAHDLKNPFHSIMGFSDLLIRNYDKIEEEKKKEFIKLIKESSTSAYGLLEDLLNWARTQTNRIKYSPSRIDISEIANEVVQIIKFNAKNKGVEIKIPGNFEKVYAFADYNMIYTVFRNLMTNALKFTDTGGAVSISTHKINGRLSISISDTGIGMSKEEKRKLFSLENFHSTDGTSGEVGTGLGFIVCREFILIHGGDIKIKSEKGKGSTFTFTLPLPEK